MTRFGYMLMTEQSGPKELVGYAAAAEDVGFDFTVCSDHFSPWLAEQGHSPYAWAVLGAVAQATHRIDLMTFVTCPILRYHPAVVAQKAATLQLLADGRFTLGLGSGESLNEHTVGSWPPVAQRQEMLVEAIQIIRELHSGELVSKQGKYFQVDSAKIWDMPELGVPIGAAVSGTKSVDRFAALADHMIAVEPSSDLVSAWQHARRPATGLPGPTRVYGQLPICWDPDRGAAIARAHEQFRWSGGGWSLNANVPTTKGFAAATQNVRPEDVADSIPCGPDLDAIVEAVRKYWEAGFTDIAMVQVGDKSQDEFLAKVAGPLLAKLRTASRS